MTRAARATGCLIVAALVLAGCAAYQPPPLAATHPANPAAPTAPEIAASHVLAYTRPDVDAIRAVTPVAAAHGEFRPAAGVAAKTVVGEGEVVAATPASGQIVVDHVEIKGFMDAMTMGYRTDPASLVATVKPGDKIRFTIDVDRRAIVHIEKLP